MNQKRILLGVSGASGTPYSMAILKGLKAAGYEVHLIVSSAAEKVIELESDYTLADLIDLADAAHDIKDFAAPPSSGSWQHCGMIICPCSMSSLASIAHGTGTNLLHRCADVTLKERRPLLIAPRETPLNQIHLKNMLAVQEAGAIIFPPSPGFYHRPQSIDDLINHVAGRMLDQMGIENNLFNRWGE
ncbi:MAG: UbiX family flavin prenyltransferase [Desulfovibrio sp.]